MKLLILRACLSVLFCASLAAEAKAQDFRDSLAVVSIVSTPAGAEVYVDSVLTGVTPLIHLSRPSTAFLLTVRIADHHEFKRIVRPVSTDTIHISVPLLPRFGFISLLPEQNDIRIIIDDTLAYHDALDSLRLSEGAHTLSVVSEQSGRSLTRRFTMDPGRHAGFRASLGYHSFRPVLLSTTLPGYAQFKEGQYLEGAAFSLGVAVSASLFLSAESEYGRALDSYRSSVTRYDNSTEEAELASLRQEVLAKFDELNSARTRRNTMLIVAVSVYVVNILDAALFYAVDDELEFVPAWSSFRLAPFLSSSRVGISIEISL